MLLEYEWGNPAAAAAAMLLFGEDSSSVCNNDGCQERQVYDHFAHGLHADLFAQAQAQAQPPSFAAAGLFPMASSTSSSTSCHQRYGLALPPAPARIGLNLGVRTYFSSASTEEGMVVGRVCRRRARTARCQAEGCGADLTHAKHYHRRHKVCEFHSKASIVIAAGLSQRFCQQCSRFHVLSEFDQGKRSCRKRLADHNRRRRKSQDLMTTATTAPVITTNIQNENNSSGETPAEKILFTASSSSTNNPRQPFMGCNPEPASPCTGVTSPTAPPPQALAPQMALGLGCYSHDNGVMVVPASAGLSGSSSTGTSPHETPSFLPTGLGDHFRMSDHHRFPSWSDGEDGSTMRDLFQSK
ncbi:hypothetical protein J5N97_018489 [Dioscorea zingiberensis]|uniref:SBP-type domain-containing protein n=1 Tax=Dioscorea zingiberensis TaxID=325984 RepID=A0A9D5HBU2_9LILI|nr:hypothetical protein J5N97_018489 [Dioscorea zingiberensis]